MWRQRISFGVIVLTVLVFASALFPLIQRSREAARKQQSKYNLRQIGLALFNYHETFNGFPMGGVFNAEKRAFHGWMSSILPQLDSSPFYNTIDFNQAWDSTTNAGLFLNHDLYYENVSETTATRHWEFPLAHYSANAHVMAVNSFTKIDEIDNPDRVFLVGELGGDFLPWGSPYNWRELNGINSSPKTFGRSTGVGCHFLFADGRVDFVSNKISSDILDQMRGADFTDFKANRMRIERPAAFPCPRDALWITWGGFGFNKSGIAVLRNDIDGNLIQLRPAGKGPWTANDSDFPIIATHHHLEILEAFGNFSDEGIERLRGMKRLRELSLHSEKLTDRAAETIGALSQLEKLDLRSNHISNAGIQSLSGLQRLRHLTLASDRITESGLSFLRELPQLELLVVRDSQMTKDAEQRLQEFLPKCKVWLFGYRLKKASGGGARVAD